MKRLSEIVFLGAALVALALYAVTIPKGVPWNESMHLALAYLGEIAQLPTMPHPIWGFYVKVFGGPIALSVALAAVAAGLLGALVNRYLGWRFAVSAALVWIFLPGMWNGAITGERGVCLAAMVVIAVWLFHALVLWVTRKARAMLKAPPVAEKDSLVETALTSNQQKAKRTHVMRISGRVLLGAAGVFAVTSAALHDYKFGEVASAYAQGIVAAAGGRVIVLNGVCDEQILKAAQAKGKGFATISLDNDEANRTKVVAWAKREWPAETNLWVAATVSPQTFVDAAMKVHPARFYLMNGTSATPAQWEKRWTDFKPYLKSSDRFVRLARRLFGYEGNGIANTLLDQDAGKADISLAAWQLYKRVYEAVDPGNIAALVNMHEMIRRGYQVSGDEQTRVREKLETFFKDANNRANVQRLVHAAGPIRADPALMEKMAAEVKKRIAAKIAAGEELALTSEALSLIEWNNEMVEWMNKGDCVKAGRIARAILSNPKWQGFIPANAIMGAVAASEGDYVASERFFQVATDTTNQIAMVTLNDYADTLKHLGKLDTAEKMARRAVAASDEKAGWICRVTLAEILVAKEEMSEKEEEEMRTLLKSVLKHAPRQVREKVRKEYMRYL